jgi:hypothetical protein
MNQFFIAPADPGTETFLDPSNSLTPLGAEANLISLCFYPASPFIQQGTVAHPTNYWLAAYFQVPGTNEFGWQTAISNYNEAAWIPAAANGTPDTSQSWRTITNTNSLGFTLAFKVNTLTNQAPIVMDIGLRVYDGTSVIKLGAQPGSPTSPIRINKNGTNYGVVLVATNDLSASRVRIQTSSGTQSLMRLP